MALSLPHRTRVSRTAMVAVLGASLLAPAAGAAPASAAAKAKKRKLPTVSRVEPMKLSVGETLTIRGRNFLRGKGKNTVVFQRTGAKAVFVKSDIATTKLIKVKLPERLGKLLVVRDGAPSATRFRIRILSARFGRRFTKDAGSPTIFPQGEVKAPGPDGQAPVTGTIIAPDGEPAVVVPPAVDGDCDGDRQLNAAETDDDDDLLSDETEHPLGLNSCNPDTDGDGVTDGYEYQSARDLNDDEYQEPNAYLPFPGKRPYPNPLDAADVGTDFDGDVLTLREEFSLWKGFGNRAAGLGALNYSDGLQCSVFARGADGRRISTLRADGYDKQAEFLAWAARTPNPDGGDGGYARVFYAGSPEDWFLDDPVAPQPAGFYDIRDVNHDGIVREGANPGDHDREVRYLSSERLYYDFDEDGLLCDNERDEDADGLTNYDESHGRITSGTGWWAGKYPKEVPFGVTYEGTNLADGDSDGDGVRDGADDQDHDDLPNLAELSRNMATGDDAERIRPRSFESALKPPDFPDPAQIQGRVNPFNPCLPDVESRTCTRHPVFGPGAPAPFGDSPHYNVFN